MVIGAQFVPRLTCLQCFCGAARTLLASKQWHGYLAADCYGTEAPLTCITPVVVPTGAKKDMVAPLTVLL